MTPFSKNEFEKYNLSLIELNEDELLSIIKEFHNYLEIILIKTRIMKSTIFCL